MRRVVAVAAALAALAMFLMVSSPPPAAAFDLTGCSVSVRSYDAKSNLLNMTNSGDEVGRTKEDPLILDPNGFVEYFADTAGRTYGDATYHVEVYGVPTPLRGSIKNASSSWNGRIWFTDVFPFSFQGTVWVSGSLEANGSTVCSGGAWVKIDGNPLPGVFGGAAMALIGLAGAFWSTRGSHPFRGVLAGLVFGAGLALLSGATGTLPLNEETPLAALIAATITGLAWGAIDWSTIFKSRPVDPMLVAKPGSLPPEPPILPNTGPVYPGDGGVSAGAGTGAAGGSPAPAGYTAGFGYVTPPPVPPAIVPVAGAVTAATVAVDTAQSPAVAVLEAPPAPPAETTPGPTTAPPETPPAEPPAGLPQLQKWEQSLDPKVRAGIDPVFNQAQNILRTGPGTLSIGGQLINDFGAQASVQVKLADGAILVGDGLARAVPFVENGKLSLSLVNANSSNLEFLAGAVAEGLSSAGHAVGGPDPLAGLRWFVDNVNAAVTNAGQSIQSIKVTPAGIQVTTCPAGG